MSGSSLDGVDIAHVQLEEVRGAWSFQLLHADCIPYSSEWASKLQRAADHCVTDFLRLHTAYGAYLGHLVNAFISKHNIDHQVHFIASHGHTVFHEPQHRTTFQLGDGAALAATTGLAVISDLRALDVALGGQGAPIVPIGDKLLFGQYDYLLNIGGIANMTMWRDGKPIAFDVCPANQVLNALAEREGQRMDENGRIAASGKVLHDVLDELVQGEYYKQAPPKSLSNEAARSLVFPQLLESSHSNADLLRTATTHIAIQVAEAAGQFPHSKEEAVMLVTGGGAFNSFLIDQLQKRLAAQKVTVIVPDAGVVKYKEAIVMALIGTLRWREETNVLCSVTGAGRDSIGGALWVA